MRSPLRSRKVTPKVKDGVVQKKQRRQLTATLGYASVRQPPGKGFRHILGQRDIRDFTDIIPDWNDLAVGLESIVLSAGVGGRDGYYHVYAREKTGSIEIHAWEVDLWTSYSVKHFEAHRFVFDRIGVAYDRLDEEWVECRYTESQARAYLLLHVFLHELGHHLDRMQTKQRAAGRRGEELAERYALESFEKIWPRYVAIFGDPRRAG